MTDMDAAVAAEPRRRVMPATRKATAFHEAGHAVVGFHCGYRLVDLSVEFDIPGNSYGRMNVAQRRILTERYMPEERYIAKALHRMEIDRRVLYKLAGPAAHRRYQPTKRRRNRSGGRDDRKQALELAELINRTPELCNAYLAWMERRAVDMVERHWSEIEAVAEELYRRRTLTGDEAEEIIRTALEARKAA